MEWCRSGTEQGGVAALCVGGTNDDASKLAPPDGTGTHGAWLDGDIECGSGQIFASEAVGGRGYGEHFGMGGDIAEAFGLIVASANDAS